MTPHQHRKVVALNNCSLQPGTRHKSFIRNMGAFAEMYPHNELTERQSIYIDQLCWKYRKQMPHDLVPDKLPVMPNHLPVPKPIASEVESVEEDFQMVLV